MTGLQNVVTAQCKAAYHCGHVHRVAVEPLREEREANVPMRHTGVEGRGNVAAALGDVGGRVEIVRVRVVAAIGQARRKDVLRA